MKYLLDTHVFLWFISGDKRLSDEVRDIIIDAKNQVYISAVSIWEATIKYQLGKISFPKEASLFLSEQRQKHFISSLSVTEKTITYLHLLPNHHKDPFDRLLICQAIENDFTFITGDGYILEYKVEGLKVLEN